MKSISRFFTALKDGVRLTPPGIEKLLADCRSGDSDRQYQAMLSLSEYYPNSATTPLIELLTSTAPTVRTQAVILLGKLGFNDRDRVGPALQHMLNDPEYLVRAEAAKALAILGYTPAEERIISLLHHDPKWAVRGAAAEALGYFADRVALTQLAQALQESTPAVRANVVKSLGTIAPPALLPTLQSLLATETNLTVKKELLAATYRLGDRDSMPPLLTMLDTAEDTDTAVEIIAAIQHLVTYKPPVSLREDEASIWEAVTRATTRFTLLASQAQDIEQALAKLQTPA